jgi:predicted phage terminase large subunit-like protein
MLQNIRTEFEQNELLKNDFGPIKTEDGEWQNQSLVIPKYETRIISASKETSIRGIRHRDSRPDLIVIDDIEDLSSVKNRSTREETYRWFKGDIVPAGERDTKMIIVGNKLHEDSLVMRLKEEIETGRLDGVYREYPIINDKGEIAWPGKFKDKKAIEAEKKKIGNEAIWHLEMMLNAVSVGDQIIKREWIQYYDQLPSLSNSNGFRYAATGIDLAISQKENASKTAMITAFIFGKKKNLKIFISPILVNERLEGLKIEEKAKAIVDGLEQGTIHQLWVEDVGFQSSMVERLNDSGYPAEGIGVKGQDKATRLLSIAGHIEGGKVLFPRKGAEVLIDQLLNFGVEKDDDLVDALTLLVNRAWEKSREGDKGRVDLANVKNLINRDEPVLDGRRRIKDKSLSDFVNRFIEEEDRMLYGEGKGFYDR